MNTYSYGTAAYDESSTGYEPKSLYEDDFDELSQSCEFRGPFRGPIALVLVS